MILYSYMCLLLDVYDGWPLTGVVCLGVDVVDLTSGGDLDCLGSNRE